MKTNIASALARFERGIQAFSAALSNLSPADLDRAPVPGEWTPRQIALHILDAEIVGAARLRWVAAQPGSSLPSYAGDIWSRQLGYESQSLETAIKLFALLRQSTLAMLQQLPDQAWSNLGVHEESGEVTLEKLLDDHCEHTEAHIRELVERLPHATSVAV
jgi:hypothetical protein